jgi:carboxylate-amine ligase
MATRPGRPRTTSRDEVQRVALALFAEQGFEETTLDDVAAVAALVHSLARLELERADGPQPPTAELIAENRFLAARDGMAARLIDPESGARIPAAAQLECLLAACASAAERLDCAHELGLVSALAIRSGASRQLAAAGRMGLRRVAAHLAYAYAPDAGPAGIPSEHRVAA